MRCSKQPFIRSPRRRARATAAGNNSFFDAKVIPSVAYTDPEVVWVGLTENEAKARGIKYGKGYFPGRRADARCPSVATRGSPRCCSNTHRIIGCAIVGPNAGDLIAKAALAIEMGADAE
jgi:dihydrolipoamide dehydrogenase